MERLTYVLLPLVGVLIGILVGQASVRPVAMPSSSVASAANSSSDRLTPFERGQLITQCYQTRIDGANTASYHLNQCLEEVNQLP